MLMLIICPQPKEGRHPVGNPMSLRDLRGNHLSNATLTKDKKKLTKRN